MSAEADHSHFRLPFRKVEEKHAFFAGIGLTPSRMIHAEDRVPKRTSAKVLHIDSGSKQKFPPVRFRSGFRRGAGVGVGFGRNPGVREPPAAFRRKKGMCRGSARGRLGRAPRRAWAPRAAAATVRTARRRPRPPPRARGSGRGGGSASRGPGSRGSTAGFPPGGTPSAPSPRRGGEHPAGGGPGPVGGERGRHRHGGHLGQAPLSVPEAGPGAVALVPRRAGVPFPVRQRERAARMAGTGLPPSTGRSVTQGSPFRFPPPRWAGPSGPRWRPATHFLLVTVSRHPVTLAPMSGREALAGAPFRQRSSRRAPSASVHRAARVPGLANGGAWPPGFAPGTERRPCRHRRAMRGPLEAGPSCGTMASRRRRSRRRPSTDRAAALRRPTRRPSGPARCRNRCGPRRHGPRRPAAGSGRAGACTPPPRPPAIRKADPVYPAFLSGSPRLLCHGPLRSMMRAGGGLPRRLSHRPPVA